MRTVFGKMAFMVAASLLIGLMINPATAQEALPLRVGVTTNYPPLIYRQGEAIVGLEVDLARRLGQELKRPVNLVMLNWEDQIPALLENRTDIIMSGMSVTPAREVRIRFAEPYLKSGLVAAFRAGDTQKYTSREIILKSFAAVGAAKGTTGDVFLQRNFVPGTRKVVLPRASDAVDELKRRSIDIFLHDAPFILWMVSANEADISALWEPFNQENLAWGVRKGEDPFFEQVDRIVKKWKSDGTLDTLLAKWLPAAYLKYFK
ncbi:MAG: transporter substrate-binding domain-containing protein [Deltaproteobacteria bacterium]|nr:transporter substrate-binding domain-containing protein [Deltaproteobacteria bacterium]